VIPAHNESARIPSTLTRLHEYLSHKSFASELIVVSNGSSDRTEDVVRQAANDMHGIELLVIQERGKGIAAKTGVLASKGEIVFLCDADLSMPPEMIDEFLRAMEGADAVVGSREAPGSRRFQEPWFRHLMGRVFNRFVQAVAVKGVEDTQCGFKAFRREAANALFSAQTVKGWGFDVEILYLAHKFGYLVKELPIDWYFDSDTRVRPAFDTLSMLREVFLIRVRGARGTYELRDAPSPDRHNVV